jgi:hypothetical protein
MLAQLQLQAQQHSASHCPAPVVMDPVIEPLILSSTAFGPLYDTVVQIPDDHSDLGNHIRPTDTVSALVNLDLPNLPTDNDNLLLVESCITNVDVCYTRDQLLRSLVPLRLWLGAIEVCLNQLLLLDPHPISLRHPTVPGLYLPLWVVTVWGVLLQALEQQAIWGRAQEWLEARGAQDTYSHMAKELMGQVVWRTTIQRLKPTSQIRLLAELLSPIWLRECHLDLFALYLGSHPMAHAGRQWFGGADLAILMRALPPASKIPNATLTADLMHYQEWVTSGSYDYLLFPAHVNGNHWVVFSVDVRGKTFCFGMRSTFLVMSTCRLTAGRSVSGDLLSGGVACTEAKYRPLRMRLRAWLEKAFSDRFVDKGNSFPIGWQQDNNSCGICVLNAMEHAAFGVPLFQHEDRFGLCIQYFVAMARYALGQVGGPFLCGQWDVITLTPPSPASRIYAHGHPPLRLSGRTAEPPSS